MANSIEVKIRGAAALLACCAILFSSCAGDDFTPVYFPPPAGDADEAKAPSENVTGRKCTITFASRLCVQIKGDNIEAGIGEGEELCSEVPPFPIHISGSSSKLIGSEFPDIQFEGGGLPVPITINARGNSDGTSNVAEGPVDSSGNISMSGFSFFISALGIVGEVPNLTFTTKATEELPHLKSTSGSPPDASGAMKLAIGTVLGSIIPAADAYLKGASMQATFTGAISPSLSECGGGSEKNISVTTLFVDPDGRQTEAPIAGEKYLDISNGTYIADTNLDIGERYESSRKFRVTNLGSTVQQISLPSKKGPFYLESVQSLNGTLKGGESISLNVTFRPSIENTEPGVITESIAIGSDQFILRATALSKSGNGSIDLIDENGDTKDPGVDMVEIGGSALPASTQRKFFRCKELDCSGTPSYTECAPCSDPSSEPCSLLPVSTEGKPMGEVDSSCSALHPDAAPLLTIDLKGNTGISLDAKKQVLAIKNSGTNQLQITSITIEELPDSQSRGQFAIPQNAIFVAKSMKEISDKIAKALAGGSDFSGSKLPATLPPFQPSYDETSMYVVVTYQPDDLLGADGQMAGIGSEVKDRAILKILTSDGEIKTEVSGTTTIQESPALEIYFKTSGGSKYVANKKEFPFKGVTAETTDISFPMFMRTSDTSQSAMRVVSISIEGEDKDMFRWLDSREKIDSAIPESGKGFRCSIPVIDESSGEMVDEIFELAPVSLSSKGFDLLPGAFTTENMPLFGCINFHRQKGTSLKKGIFNADLKIVAQELDSAGNPAKNPDGSYRQTTMSAVLKAAINPRSGMMVLRVTQTMSAILNPKFPGLSSISSKHDRRFLQEEGKLKDSDYEVFLGAIILDPFDEMHITSTDGQEIVSTPGDGVTSVFRAVDTHPVTTDYPEENAFDFASLLHDSELASDKKGIFNGYPNVPEDLKSNGWRIFTSTLSYPGPLPPPGVPKPDMPSDCEVVNPCDPEGLKKFTKSGVKSGEKGACAFFYASGGRFDSPAFHTSEEMDGGEYENLCNRVNKKQTLKDVNTGYYSIDGAIVFEEVGLRFFGPTFFHNPGGPLGNYPPMDEVFHMTFTTEMLKPQKSPEDFNMLPDEKINISKSEFKINLDDPKLISPPICKTNSQDVLIGGKIYDSWRYIEGLLFKDEEGTIPAGCPGEGSSYTGGSAYLRGKPVDHETGTLTIVTGAKFGSNEELSFAFKDVMMFVVMKGWICDPLGREEEFEGSRCYDRAFNERDAEGQQSLSE